MDAHHAKLMEQVELGILHQAELEEKKLDEKLKKLEDLGEILFKHLIYSLLMIFILLFFLTR